MKARTVKRKRESTDVKEPFELAQDRLNEWHRWHHEGHFALTPSGQSVEARLIESNVDRFRTLNASWWRRLWKKTDRHMPCKETRNSSGDGGMAAFVDRAYEALMFDKRCREVQDAYEAMSDEMRAIVQARYIGGRRDTPRSFAKCSFLLANGEGPPLPDSTIFDRHKRMLEWLANRLRLGTEAD